MSWKVKEINLAGSWFDMGAELGQLRAESIEKFNNDFFSHPVNIFRFGSIDRIKEYVSYARGSIKDFSPEIWEFIRGIADGSKLSLEEILLQIYLPELTHINSEEDLQVSLGCTACGVSSKRTDSGHSIIAQNWDFNFDLPEWYILRLEPNDLPQILTIGAGAVFACCGFNTTGIGVTFTSSGHLPNIPPHRGLPVVGLVLETLIKDNFIEARDIAAGIPKAGSFNLLLTDGYRDLAVIECTPDRVEIIEGEEILVCGNHYQHPKMIDHTNQNLFPKKPPSREFAQSTTGRVEHLLALLEGSPSPITVDYIKSCLTDHYNFPFSICAHSEGTILGFKTLGSVVFEPAKLKGYFSPSQPCKNEFVEFIF